MSKSQTGARYIKRQREQTGDKATVCIQHYIRESELLTISKNVVKRKREK